MELGNFASYLIVVKVVYNNVNLSHNEIWHYKLRHLSYMKLQVLFKELHIFCDLTTSHHFFICYLAKQCCLPFVSHNSLSNSPFQLIHSDIRSVFHVANKKGYYYFVHHY